VAAIVRRRRTKNNLNMSHYGHSPTENGAGISAHRRNSWALLAVSVTILVLYARLVLLVHGYAVNVFFWDEWDYLTPLIEDRSWWKCFTWQLGPHRQGPSFLLSKILLDATAWSSKAHAYSLTLLSVLTAVTAVHLKRRLFGGIVWQDVAIPAIFLTVQQQEVFLTAPNPAAQVFPILLIVLYCSAWTLRHPLARTASILAINFGLIYSGYGLLMGLITPVLLAVETVKQRGTTNMAYSILALIISILSLVSFFVDYRLTTAAPCFEFPYHNLSEYPRFAGRMVINFFGWKGIGVVPATVGLLLLGSILATLGYHAAALLQKRSSDTHLDVVIVVLMAYSVLLIVATTVVRICLGAQLAQPSRYVTYVIPAFFAAYLHLLTMRRSLLSRTLLIVFLIWSLYASLNLSNLDRRNVDRIRSMKQAWRACYLSHENIDRCNREAGFPIHPNPMATGLQEKLDYLKRNRLNLYAPAR
jgi:hypothetical protein